MVEIIDVHKKGAWYTVEGAYNGKKVSADIHAYYVDSDGLNGGWNALARAVAVVAQGENSKE